MVRVTGLEPAVSWSQTTRDTKLRYTRIGPVRVALVRTAATLLIINHFTQDCKRKFHML